MPDRMDQHRAARLRWRNIKRANPGPSLLKAAFAVSGLLVLLKLGGILPWPWLMVATPPVVVLALAWSGIAGAVAQFAAPDDDQETSTSGHDADLSS